jgi:group I intron endonuclease
MGIIYILENKINGKHYVGQTIQTFNERFNGHKSADLYIDKAIRKYGITSFEIFLLENVPKEELNYWECHYISECHSLFPNGYNMSTGGNKNKHPCVEVKRKQSEVKKGKNNPMYGKIHTEETRRKMKEKRALQIFSKETKKKMSEKVVSKEVKEKISNANKGNTYRLNKPHTEEAKKKMSESHKGQILWNKGKKIGSSKNA